MISVVQSSKHLNSMTRQLVASKVFVVAAQHLDSWKTFHSLHRTKYSKVQRSPPFYHRIMLIPTTFDNHRQRRKRVVLSQWKSTHHVFISSSAAVCTRERCNSIKFKVSALLVIIVEEKKGADSWSSSASSARINDGWRILNILWSVGVATHCRHCHRCRKKRILLHTPGRKVDHIAREHLGSRHRRDGSRNMCSTPHSTHEVKIYMKKQKTVK